MDPSIWIESTVLGEGIELEVTDEYVASYLSRLLHEAELEQLKELLELADDVERKREVRGLIRDVKHLLKE